MGGTALKSRLLQRRESLLCGPFKRGGAALPSTSWDMGAGGGGAERRVGALHPMALHPITPSAFKTSFEQGGPSCYGDGKTTPMALIGVAALSSWYPAPLPTRLTEAVACNCTPHPSAKAHLRSALEKNCAAPSAPPMPDDGARERTQSPEGSTRGGQTSMHGGQSCAGTKTGDCSVILWGVILPSLGFWLTPTRLENVSSGEQRK